MNIKGKRVILRAMGREDMKMICDMFNDPELENLVVGWSFPISLEQQNHWYDTHINDNNNFRFVIEVPGEGTVGIATLTGIDWKNRIATHGIKLANVENRSKGIGTDVVMAIMRYAFDELQLHRLETTQFEENIASCKLYRKCGWKEEGRKRECIYKRGTYRDLIVVGILDSDYRELVNKTNYWDE